MFDSYFDNRADNDIVDFSIQRKVLLCAVLGRGVATIEATEAGASLKIFT